jgi:predicted DNA-binding protein
MSEQTKTIAIRVKPELSGRLDAILNILGITKNQAGIEALEAWVAKKLADPKVRAKALADLEARQRELDGQRTAFQGLIGDDADEPTEPKPDAKPAVSDPADGKPTPRRSGTKPS